MTDSLYIKFVKRWEEVTDIPPQQLGSWTPLYKSLVSKLKVMPWPVFLMVALVFVLVVYLFLGTAITVLVSLLQRGF